MVTDDPAGGVVARSFTRARVLGTYLARVPLGDKSFDLPAVLSRAQLLVAATGVIGAALAWAVGSAWGIAAWLVTPVLVVTVVAVVAVKFSAVPDRGTAVFLGGYARMLAAAVGPLASTRQSSAAGRRGQRRPVAASVQLVFHPAPPSAAPGEVR